jgi:hypothetical protein
LPALAHAGWLRDLLVACSTVLAGTAAILGAIVAWRSVQTQIKSAEKIEKLRYDKEVTALELGFTAEFMVYSRSIIEAASIWNRRAVYTPNQPAATNLPLFVEPLYFPANVGTIGRLRQPWVGGAIIGFYSNLRELDEQTKEELAGRPTVNVTCKSIAQRMQLMASNLAQALDGLNDDRKFSVPADLDTNTKSLKL